MSAPGEADWAVCDASGNFSGVHLFKGTLLADPGLRRHQPVGADHGGRRGAGDPGLRKTHGGTQPTPAVVKQIITSTAHDLGFAGDVQGTGRVDARAAVEAALNWAGGTTPAGHVAQPGPVDRPAHADRRAGTTATGSVKVTNEGSSAMTVVPSTRQYASLGWQTSQTFQAE